VFADRDPSLRDRRNADLQRFLWLGPVYGSDLRRSFEPGLRELRDPKPDLQQRGVVGLGNLRRRGRLLPDFDAGMWNGRHPDLHGELFVGDLHCADL
jgi:hypothetical protein